MLNHTREKIEIWETIKDASPEQIKYYLRTEAWLLDYRDSDNNNVLHIAASSTPEIMACVLDQLTESTVAILAEEKNKWGNTPLHNSAKFQSQILTALLIDKMGMKAEIVAKQINLEGCYPLKLLERNWRQSSSYQKILEKITLPDTQPKLTDKIKFQDVMARYPEMNDQLKFHFKLACFAINETRNLIKLSTTHPSINAWGVTSKTALIQRLDKMRDELTKRFSEIKNDESLDVKSKLAEKREALIDIAHQTHIGNCSECATVAAILIRRLFPTISLNIFEIKNGDHVFLVIGLPPNSSNDYKTWDENVVICDPWSGKTYKSSEMELYLKNRSSYSSETRINILTAFEPKYHVLKPLAQAYIHPIQAKESANPMLLDALLFLSQEKFSLLEHSSSITPQKKDQDEKIQEEKPEKRKTFAMWKKHNDPTNAVHKECVARTKVRGLGGHPSYRLNKL